MLDTFGDLIPPRELDAQRDGAMGWFSREGGTWAGLCSAGMVQLAVLLFSDAVCCMDVACRSVFVCTSHVHTCCCMHMTTMCTAA
jgi:hypothetical protein